MGGPSETQQKASEAGFLARGGEMGAMMRSFDWSRTALGPIESWPQSLRTSVSICLNSRFPMILWWGPELTVLYNDPYTPILGKKHPDRALGLPGAEVWSEVWPVIEPLLMQVMVHGEANWADDLQLFLNRNGYPEECYFRFSYSPISDESGGIGGVFTPVSDTTQKVVAERRLLTLRELAECGNRSQTAVESCLSMSAAIGKNPYDLPFAALYLVNPDGTQADLVATSMVAAGTGVSPQVISFSRESVCRISILAQQAMAEGVPLQVLSDLTALGTMPPGPWGDAPSALVLLSIALPGQTNAAAFLVAGVSARKHLDADYRSFFELVAQQIGTAVAAARAYEEERKRAEALAELDRAKTVFFSNVSHELRTPLTLIVGPVEQLLARASELPTDVLQQLTMAHRNSLRLLKMVNTLLDFSRIEAGRIRASYEPTDLASFTTDLASTFRSLIESSGLKLTVECSPLSQPVWVDTEMWEKVVLNLISNAFKFTFEGGVTIRLEERAGRALLSVQDTGTGIPDDELPRIFDRFHRVAGASGRTQEGTGIGLALVAELVHLHGGTVGVQSSLGKGSTFVVSLPLGTAHLPQEHLAPAKNLDAFASSTRTYLEEANRWTPHMDQAFSGGEGATHRARVLLVDDNSDMREYVAGLLSERYTVETAANGKQALARAIENPPDLVLSDIMMPELDGFALLEALRKNTNTRGVPVILLSARAGEEAVSEGMGAGADDYLVKPFSANELMARVGAHLRLSLSRKESELREAELRAEAEAARDHAVSILESITDGFFVLDKDWCFTYVNPTGEKLLRMTREELLGKNHWELFPATIGSNGEAAYRRAIRDKVPVEFEIFYEPWERWYAVKAYATDLGGLSVYFQDVTDRKQAEEAVRESERRFRELADNISQFAWMADAQGSIFWYNQRWYDYTGTTTEQMLGWGWVGVHHPDYLDGVIARFRAAVAAGNVWEDTFPLKSRAGEWRWFLSRARPIHDESGKIVRWFGTNTDVTEQLQTEKNLRRANQDLEQFAFSASHDLQEPLRNVAIYSQLLEKRCQPMLDAQSEQFIGYIREGASRMGHLIADLLAYTQAAMMDDEPVTVVASELVFGQVVSGLARIIEETKAEITHDPLPEVAVKDVHLQQLLQNLIGNGIKYRKDGEVPRVHVTATRIENQWKFSVKDNGIGIAPQFHDKVFGIFKRLHPKGGKYPGTGIGLAICQRIVERYGGRIWLDSDAGQGTTFLFTLPAAGGEGDGR